MPGPLVVLMLTKVLEVGLPVIVPRLVALAERLVDEGHDPSTVDLSTLRGRSIAALRAEVDDQLGEASS
jgi:hypothetical protein